MADTKTDLASRMLALFVGFPDAHGTYDSLLPPDSRGKRSMKNPHTLRAPLTVELWQQHLAGTRPLGVVPILPDGTCQWGVCDIDDYTIDVATIAEKVEKASLPLVVTRSKSGGAYVFLFTTEPVPAAEMRSALMAVAARMGVGEVEIFPKQTEVKAEKGDVGNWLNMPYLGGDATERPAVRKTGAALTVAEFLDLAESRRLTREQFAALVVLPKTDGDMEGGPPCLQCLVAEGFPAGSRNNGLFNLGVFCRKKFGDKWKDKLAEMNQNYMDPPKAQEDLNSVISSLGKKEYFYKCKEMPIVAHCAAALCRNQRYGVGGGGKFPVIAGLSVLKTEPRLWFLDLEERRVELVTEQLLNYSKFQIACAEQLVMVHHTMAQPKWMELVAAQMPSVVEIDAPADISRAGHFHELLRDFLTNRHKGDRKEDILLGRPWQDPDTQRHYFRIMDLMIYLDRCRFYEYTRQRLSTPIKALGGAPQQLYIKGTRHCTWWVPGSAVEDTPTPEPRQMPEDKV